MCAGANASPRTRQRYTGEDLNPKDHMTTSLQATPSFALIAATLCARARASDTNATLQVTKVYAALGELAQALTDTSDNRALKLYLATSRFLVQHVALVVTAAGQTLVIEEVMPVLQSAIQRHLQESFEKELVDGGPVFGDSSALPAASFLQSSHGADLFAALQGISANLAQSHGTLLLPWKEQGAYQAYIELLRASTHVYRFFMKVIRASGMKDMDQVNGRMEMAMTLRNKA